MRFECVNVCIFTCVCVQWRVSLWVQLYIAHRFRFNMFCPGDSYTCSSEEGHSFKKEKDTSFNK